MIKTRKKRVTRDPHGLSVSRPTTASLLVHILKSGFSVEMLWLVILGGAAMAYFKYDHITMPGLLPLIIALALVIAVLRGFKEWKNDWYEYHQGLIDLRWSDAGGGHRR